MTGELCEDCSRPKAPIYIECTTFGDKETSFVEGPSYCPHCAVQLAAEEVLAWERIANDLYTALRRMELDKQATDALISYERRKQGRF